MLAHNDNSGSARKWMLEMGSRGILLTLSWEQEQLRMVKMDREVVGQEGEREEALAVVEHDLPVAPVKVRRPGKGEETNRLAHRAESQGQTQLWRTAGTMENENTGAMVCQEEE